MCPIYSPHHVASLSSSPESLPEGEGEASGDHPDPLQDPLEGGSHSSPSFASSGTPDGEQLPPAASPTAHALLAAPEQRLLQNGPTRQNILAALSGNSEIRSVSGSGSAFVTTWQQLAPYQLQWQGCRP